MGLQKNITLDSGVELTQSYIKINSVYVVFNSSVTMGVSIYKDFAARQANLPSVVEFKHVCKDADFFTYFAENVLIASGKTTLSQSYIWLKTLPFYENAIDVNIPVKE